MPGRATRSKAVNRLIDEVAECAAATATDLKINFPEMDDNIFELQVKDIVRICFRRRLPLSGKLARYLRNA